MPLGTISYQSGWKECSKCFCLFFPDTESEGGTWNGVCFDGLEHSPSSVGTFKIPFAGRGHVGQTNWRYCFRCASLFFNGHQTKGHCPADGGPHSSYGSGNYELKHTTDTALDNIYAWRWCRKCEQLFYCPFAECSTRCNKGGGHDKSASGYYKIDSAP